MIKINNWLKTFYALAKINNLSGNEELLADHIAGCLKKEKISHQKDNFGNLICKLDGSGAPLLLAINLDKAIDSQSDIVLKRKGEIIRTDGKNLLGLNKAVIATLLETLKYLKNSVIKNRPIEVAFTRLGEEGYEGTANLDFSKIRSKEAICLDLAKPVGTLVKTTPYIYYLDIEIKGQGSHSGRSPENANNALKIAADAISNLKLGKVSQGLTVNMSDIIIEGARCIIPGNVKVIGEVRSLSIKQAQTQIDLINKVFKKFVRKQKAKLVFKSRLVVKGRSINAKDEFWKMIASSIKKAGNELKVISTCAGSSAGILAARKIKAVQIGSGGKYSHTKKEMIKTSEISDLAKLLILIARNV